MKTNGNRLLGSAVAAAVWWCFGGVAAMAADPTIVGVWWSPKKDAKIEITEKDGIYSGQIIAGINRLDDKNPKQGTPEPGTAGGGHHQRHEDRRQGQVGRWHLLRPRRRHNLQVQDVAKRDG